MTTTDILPFPAPAGATVHDITIKPAAIGWIARCSCGWCAAGLDKRRMEAMAGSHDLDEVG